MTRKHLIMLLMTRRHVAPVLKPCSSSNMTCFHVLLPISDTENEDFIVAYKNRISVSDTGNGDNSNGCRLRDSHPHYVEYVENYS